MSKLLVAGIFLVGIGIGAVVQDANQEPEVVTETVTIEKKIPVEIFRTDIKTVTQTAPAPPPPTTLPGSCEAAMKYADKMYEITARYSDRSGRISDLMSQGAVLLHKADGGPDSLDTVRSNLLQLRSEEVTDLRDMGTARYQYDQAMEECR